MKLLSFLFFIYSSLVFSQSESSVKKSKNNLSKSAFTTTYIENLNWKTEISSNTGDTIKTGFDQKNYLKEITIKNADNGISEKQFHSYAKTFTSSFKITHSFQNEFSNFFYDSMSKQLTSKIFESDKKTKIIAIHFLMDANTIINQFPELKNL